jgi:hypothetical protein
MARSTLSDSGEMPHGFPTRSKWSRNPAEIGGVAGTRKTLHRGLVIKALVFQRKYDSTPVYQGAGSHQDSSPADESEERLHLFENPKKQAPMRQPSQQAKQEVTKPPKGSVTPVMDTVRTPAPDNSSGQLGPGDIRRTRSPNDQAHLKPVAAKPATVASLGSVRGYTAEMGRSSAIRRISCGADLTGAAE